MVTKEQLNEKRNELLASKAEIVKMIVLTDEELEELAKTTNKDETSESFGQLESEILRLSKEYGLVNSEQKHLESLFLLKELERKIEVQLRYLGEVREEKEDAVKQLEKMCINEKREKKKLKNEEEMEEKALKQKL